MKHAERKVKSLRVGNRGLRDKLRQCGESYKNMRMLNAMFNTYLNKIREADSIEKVKEILRELEVKTNG